MIETHLYGKLRSIVQGSKPNEDTVAIYQYKENETFNKFIERLGLSPSDLGGCFINGILAKLTDVIPNGARIGLFPFNMVLLCGGQHLKGHGFTRLNFDINYY